MIAVALLSVFMAAALVGIAAKGWNLHRSFPWISSVLVVLFLASIAGLRTDSNSLV
jgi:hypothetical protein